MRPVVFLHIPKTAGQSVHAYLENSYPLEKICPARDNSLLNSMSILKIRSYTVFSGHLDWALLDCLQTKAFTFTILRDPIERILSFYFFLRRQARLCGEDELKHPHARGLHAALFLSPDDFFCGGDLEMRAFLDDLFDNFYTFFFAGRSYDARRRVFSHIGESPASLTMSDVVECAKSNLGELSGVYRVSELDRLEQDLAAVLPNRPKMSLASIRENVEGASVEDRLAAMRSFGPAALAIDRIEQMCVFDNLLWHDPDTFIPR